MGVVVPLGCITTLDIPADRVLENAIGEYEGVVLIGYDKDGELRFFSTYADGGEVLWLLEKTKQALFSAAEKVEQHDGT